VDVAFPHDNAFPAGVFLFVGCWSKVALGLQLADTAAVVAAEVVKSSPSALPIRAVSDENAKS